MDEAKQEKYRPFGNFIRARREAQGRSQDQLGSAIGVNQVTISTWELGYSRPRSINLEALAKELHVPLAELRLLAGYPSKTETAEPSAMSDAVITFYMAHREILSDKPWQAILLAVMRGLVDNASNL